MGSPVGITILVTCNTTLNPHPPSRISLHDSLNPNVLDRVDLQPDGNLKVNVLPHQATSTVSQRRQGLNSYGPSVQCLGCGTRKP